MKKELSVTGVNGIFNGFVEVLLNERRENKMVHNSITHDEEPKTIYYTVIRGEAEGKSVSVVETIGENNLVGLVDNMEKSVMERLQFLASRAPIVTNTDALKQRGYK